MKIRKFLLENEKGKQLNMNDLQNGCLLVSPTNLGYSFKSEFNQLGNSFIEDNRKIDKKDPSGVAYFKSYEKYKEFVDFIEQAENLKWIYIVPYEKNEEIYYRDVSIKSINKTEKKAGLLACSVSFNGLSLWYKQNVITYSIEPQTSEIRWDFRWDSSFMDYDSRSLQYINDGHIEAPVEIEISGHVVNPKIELYIEGQLYQTVPFNVEINSYEKLLYGTKENNFYIEKQHTDGTRESLFNLDVITFENDNVIRLPVNKSCELRLTADNEVANAQITIFPQYVAV